MGVAEATKDELYQAMDWLLARKERIEKKLAARHMKEGGLVLYDVTSSSYEGCTCPLAQYGHNRDGEKALPSIVYGVMTDGERRPVGVEVYAGSTDDPTTVADQVEKLRERSGLERVQAHVFLCLLAYYVEWHLRRAWAPLLFEDEERQEERKRRDPIPPAEPSASGRAKKRSQENGDGLPVHCFQTLLSELASRARVTYALQRDDSDLTFRQVPEPTPLQARAYELIRTFPVSGCGFRGMVMAIPKSSMCPDAV